jgi:hypothetical protein
MSGLNDRLKDAVAYVRKPGEPCEVFWHYVQNDCSDFGEPWDQDRHGAWMGELVGMRDLRAWLKGRAPDGRAITIYCRGDDAEVLFDARLEAPKRARKIV